MESLGVIIRQVGVRAPFQLGTGERHGGILKTILKTAIYERQITGATDMSALISECAKVKNHLSNENGYSPVQWVLGHTPRDPTSLIEGDPETHLGSHQAVVDESNEMSHQDVFQRQLLMRQYAKEAYAKADASNKIRKSMLRKSRPMRGPYQVGDLISFFKKDRWYGPARVLGHEGRSSLWIIHGGVCILVAETSVRPATSEEVLKKQLLELRPARRGRPLREVYVDPEDDEDLPFSSDVISGGGLQGGDQVPYVELPTEPVSGGPNPVLGADELMSAAPAADDYSPTTPLNDEAETPLPMAPPGLEDDQVSVHTGVSQPEPEFTPQVTQLQDTLMPSQLTQALRRDPDALDGLPRGHHQGEVDDEALMTLEQRKEKRKTSDSFLVMKTEKKYRKKTQKVGAGMELNYEREDEDTQKELQETMQKEWSNWERYTDGRWIEEDEFNQLRQDNPALKVIPTRWVHTNKAEPNQPRKLKSRLVVRGDLEDSSSMRCDSPTGSQLCLSLVFSMSATRDTTLWSGDISAAFLQGSQLDRILILSAPRGGIPGVDLSKPRYYLVSTTAYGTKDAPRGWFKTLDGSLKHEGFKAICFEPAAHVLHYEKQKHGKEGVAGLLVVHVDDLLWTGGPEIEEKMVNIQKKYNFGKISKDDFVYCGRQVKKTPEGVEVTCPSIMDRVRPIFLETEQKKHLDRDVNEGLRGQLRSVIGSLAWFSRVCRPDLAYSVSKLQACVHAAKLRDVAYANKIIQIAKQSKEKGLFYHRDTTNVEDAMIVAIQDASHAADYDMSESGKKLGHRSQSGRLLCLAPRHFKETKTGRLTLLEWHSTVLKRVCRSTLQAETLSLLAGSEEAEHLRLVLYSLRDGDFRRPGWMIQALDEIEVQWYTDCRSLYDYINHSGLNVVGDKRLAIDLCGLRQQAWRRLGEEHGDPLITDHVPSDATTSIEWTSTDRMLADPLTKGMRHEGMELLMTGNTVSLIPTKEKACEIGDANLSFQ